METIERKLTISNQSGLHGRASAKLVETARRFEAEIWLVREDAEADCKSILDVMTMACTKGTPLQVKARGADAEKAVTALAELVKNKFGEE